MRGLLCRLHEHVRSAEHHWTVADGDMIDRWMRGGVLDSAPGELRISNRSASYLVYLMRDERNQCDSLYVFTMESSFQSMQGGLLDVIVPQIDAVLRRVRCLDLEVDGLANEETSRLSGLSERELEVMQWVSCGKSNEEIGFILGISHNTVKNHLKRIFHKLSVSSRSEAASVFVLGSQSAA